MAPSGTRRPARLVLQARLAEQVAEVGRRDGEVRRGEPEGVHQLRVACRRLRGALATFRPLVDREVTDPVRDELRWLAHVLGEARDLEVAHARLRALVDAQPASLVVGPVRRRLDRTYRPLRQEAMAGAREALDSDRYVALRAQLDQLAAAPPFTPLADAVAGEVLPDLLHRELHRVQRLVEQAAGCREPGERDEATHAARRAVKRLRYAAEAVGPVWPADAGAVVEAAKTMSAELGARQDAVVARPQLLRLAAQAEAAGESPFTYGVLHAEERRLADGVDARLGDLLADLDRSWREARW